MRFLRGILALVAGGLIVCAPSTASAACTKETASTLYQNARKAFDEKRFDDAVSLLREANACDPNPVYFANIARALEEAHRPREALAAWKSYRDVVVDAKERSRAQGRIVDLEKAVADLDERERQEKEAQRASEDRQRREAEEKESARAAQAKKEEKQPSSPSGHAVSPLPFIVAGVGLAAIGVGLGLGASAGSKHDSAVAEPDVTRASELQTSAESLGRTANIVIIAGGIVAAGGIAWIGIELLRPRDHGGVTAKAAVRGNGLFFSGTF